MIAAGQERPDHYPAQEHRPSLRLVGSAERAADALGAAGSATASSEAMTELWRRHGTALLRFALKLTLGDKQRAEDIVQETMLRAWRHPEVVGDGDLAVRPWLITVTRRVAIDMWRARARIEETTDDAETDRPDPAERIEQAVTALDVHAALAQLTPEHREVIVAMYLQGRSVAEVSDALGIPAGTVKSRTYYGLRQLRRLLSTADGHAGAAVRGVPA
jgi:RNA polymerase sigma-70 factor (ECF subfamily)